MARWIAGRRLDASNSAVTYLCHFLKTARRGRSTFPMPLILMIQFVTPWSSLLQQILVHDAGWSKFRRRTSTWIINKCLYTAKLATVSAHHRILKKNWLSLNTKLILVQLKCQYWRRNVLYWSKEVKFVPVKRSSMYVPSLLRFWNWAKSV